MENYSLLMGAAAVMKMAVEMAAVSMEKPSGALPRSGRVPEQRLCLPDLGFAMAAAPELFSHSQKKLRTILTARSQLRCIEQLTAVLVSTVEVLFDGQGRMYLDKGWEKFAIAHGVDFGCYVHFKYEGDDMLTMKVFNGTMCRLRRRRN
ncbi:hypothetical protein QYE76_063751 [Lolium multiflorum]|uniref:TF-B3 domain-containing protein n=1 Tax=Lolium multiflorum TaxID=4521 RepID=A0AAD8W6W8_LOLMU|nr:hypothetical protein QYE76_063751 [Lolium multiflorum]